MRTPLLVEAKQKIFLEVFARVGNVTQAAKAVGLTRDRHYYWARNNPQYRNAFRRAHQAATARLDSDRAVFLRDGCSRAAGDCRPPDRST